MSKHQKQHVKFQLKQPIQRLFQKLSESGVMIVNVQPSPTISDRRISVVPTVTMRANSQTLLSLTTGLSLGNLSYYTTAMAEHLCLKDIDIPIGRYDLTTLPLKENTNDIK